MGTNRISFYVINRVMNCYGFYPGGGNKATSRSRTQWSARFRVASRLGIASGGARVAERRTQNSEEIKCLRLL